MKTPIACRANYGLREYGRDEFNEVLIMNQFWKQSGLLWAATILVLAGTSSSSQGQTGNQPPAPALSRADEVLKAWNQIGNKLIAMAQDFPEDKYDFKVQKKRFAQKSPIWFSLMCRCPK
jgi:hypothetical protein